MNDFKREDESLIQAQLAAVERVLRSGRYVLGGEVKAFESEWAEWIGATEAVGVANGMDALEIGLRALGIGHGDEIVTTPMTAFATALSILRAGAQPVLADIDPDTANLDVASVERCLSPRTKAVMVVHLYGQVGPLEDLSRLCSGRGILLLEDCAQAHGAKASGRPAGTWGAFAGWSFYPTKNLGCIGDGGALTTEDHQLAEQARTIRNYGQSVRYQHPTLGLNSRLDELQAAILRERLKRLSIWTSRRREIARIYADGIRNPSATVLPLPTDAERHVHHLFVLTTPRRENLQAHLLERGVESLFHYPVPIHHQAPCRGLRIDPEGLAVSQRHARECISIPINPSLTDSEIGRIVDAVNSWKG